MMSGWALSNVVRPVRTSRMAVLVLVVVVLTIQIPCSAAFSTSSVRTSTASGCWGTTVSTTSCVNHVNGKHKGPSRSIIHNMVTSSQEAAIVTLTAEQLQSMTVKALKERIQEQFPNERTSQFRLKKDFVSFLLTQQQQHQQQEQEVSAHVTSSEDPVAVLTEEDKSETRAATTGQAGKRTGKPKRVLTEDELQKRRKSPALW
eukprot:scaffold15840_cov43-Attheya_sp.AAC.2